MIDQRFWRFGIAAALTACAALTGCAKPCEGIAASTDAKRLGIVLDGGRVCNEDKSTATIDYPDVPAESLTDSYKTALEKAGWKAELAGKDGVVYATKDADTLFIVSGKKSKERGVPFAVVRYCTEDYCRKSLSELAEAMKKY